MVHVSLFAGRLETAGNLLQQLAVLRPRYPAALLEVSALACQMRDWQLAEQIWRNVLEMASRRLPEVYAQWAQTGNPITFNQVVPEHRATVIAAAERQLKAVGTLPDRALVDRALDYLALPISGSEWKLKQRLVEIKQTSTPEAITRQN
jgi:hypothetical protein